MPKNVSVSVPQKDGEIVLALDGRDATTYKVNDGTVSVSEESVARFLTAVGGSKVAGGNTTAATKKES